MRDWLKDLLGVGNKAIPDGIPATWIDALRKQLAKGHVLQDCKLKDGDIDDAIEHVLAGSGAWTHPPLKRSTGYVSYYHPGERERADPHLIAPLATIPPDVALRAAQVIGAQMMVQGNHHFKMALPGGVNWPEAILQVGSGQGVNTYPASTEQTLPYASLERMLVAAGMEPSAVLSGAFATPVDSNMTYGASPRLRSVSYAPDYPQALDRHVEVIRPLLLAGNMNQRLHVLALLERALPQTIDTLASEMVEFATSSSKQIRLAAEKFMLAAGDAIIEPLRRLAREGKPEQRVLALRNLHERGKRLHDVALVEFARSTAAADKAASVQALPAEWEGATAADSAPEAKYDIAAPVIDWAAEPDAHVIARAEKLIDDINVLIRAENKRRREHYESYSKSHGKPKWNLHQDPELDSDAARRLKGELRGGGPPRKHEQPPRIWIGRPAVQAFAGESFITPVQLMKVLQFLNMMFDRQHRLTHDAAQGFNRLHKNTGRPSLLELGRMVADCGQQPATVLASYCSSHGIGVGRGWDDGQVWPFIASHVQLVERFLLGQEQTDYWFDRAGLYAAIATLPTPPPRLVNALFTVALGQGKSERLDAQEALSNQPNKEARIIAALADGKSEVRSIAAQWLGRLRHAPAIPALAKAVSTEKHDTAKGAMLDALQALGEPVDKYLKRESLLPESKKILAKGIPKELEWLPWDALPQVHWADNGEAVPVEVLKWMVVQASRAKSPEPNAVLRKYCAMFEPRQREQFGQWVLEQWLREDVAPISPEEAQKRARSQAQSTWQSMQTHAQYYQGNPLLGKSETELHAIFLPPLLRTPRGSAIASKGVLAVAAACAAERAAAPVQRYIKEWYGTRVSQGKSLIAMLAWIEHPSATQVMLAIGNRFRTKSLQEEATRQAEALAERKGWTLAELADRTIPSAGFDENGELELSYGQRSFLAKLLPDFKIELFNPEGKKVASLPEPRQDDDAELAKESRKGLSAAKKELKSIVELQTDRLYEALCTGREWPVSDWNDYLLRHPVVRHLVQRVVWLSQAGSTPLVFRPLDDGTLSNADDEPLALPAGARVRVAHDSLLDADTVKQWQKHLVDYEIEPLFQQLGKGTYELPADKRDATEITDFKGHMLEAFALRGRTGKLGYTRGTPGDGGWFMEYEKRFPTLGITAVLEFTGSPLPEENRSVALRALSFASAAGQNSWERSALPLRKIPRVLLSECYNDVRLIAAEGTGFDPDWEKKSAY